MIYKLSTDYKRLFELVMRGESVVCFISYTITISDGNRREFRDLCRCIMRKNGDIDFISRGMCYLSFDNGVNIDDFAKQCESDDVQWIVPNAEVDCE